MFLLELFIIELLELSIIKLLVYVNVQVQPSLYENMKTCLFLLCFDILTVWFSTCVEADIQEFLHEIQTNSMGLFKIQFVLN